MTPEEKLEKLGVSLPHVAAPVANYVPNKVVGDLVFVSGQLPVAAGELAFKGSVPDGVSEDCAVKAARLAAINLLAAARAAAGELGRVEVVRVEGFVASSPGYTRQPTVINGASDFLVEVLGDAGRHTRFAVGVAELPLGAPVEVGAIFRIVS
jgi:enamine deaminase RidA (YjgF/YER057c/UK114 family)